jgi:hypothetical protein
MRAVSDALLSTIRGSHAMAARARVCETFQTGTGPDGTEIDIFGGNTVHDASAQVQSTLDLLTDGYGRFPHAGNLLLAPYGNEIFVERGARVGGSTEWVSLGYFRIEAPEQQDAPDGPIRILGKDRMAGIVDARLLAPVQFLSTATYGDVLEQLVLEVYPAATIEWDSGSATTLDRDLICEDRRYEFLADLIEGLGKIWYWDYRGILVVRDLPHGDPVFDVDSGAGGVLVRMSRELTRQGVYNAVVATGEGADTAEPVRGVAVDSNPDSPTYFGGPFGKVPEFITSPTITDVAQAQNAADARLRKQLGLRHGIDFTAVPNPALEPWDHVLIRRRDGIDIHVLDQVRISLTADQPMTAVTRDHTHLNVGLL